MKQCPRYLAITLCAVATAGVGESQEKKKDGAKDNKPATGLVARMLAFEKNKDGKLTKDEITDPRLLRLFNRADANKDGVVTREELEALAAQEEARGGGEKGGFGKDGFGKGGFGKGGFDKDGFGKGGFGKGGF